MIKKRPKIRRYLYYSFGGHSGEGSVSASGLAPHDIAKIDVTKAVILIKR